MSKPATTTGRMLRSVGNISNAFASYSRTESSNHEINAKQKLQAQTDALIEEVAINALNFGYPMAASIDPNVRVESKIGLHEDFMRPSLKKVYNGMTGALVEIKRTSIPRFSPGILEVLLNVDVDTDSKKLGGFELERLCDATFDPDLREHILFFRRCFDFGKSTVEVEQRFTEIGNVGEAVRFAIDNMGTPPFLERGLDGKYILSPLGKAGVEITKHCLEVSPAEPIC